MSILEILFKYGLEKLDNKLFQKKPEENLSIQDRLQDLYKSQKMVSQFDKLITEAKQQHLAKSTLIYLGTAANPYMDHKESMKGVYELRKTELSSFMNYIDGILPGSADQIAEAKDFFLKRLWNHVDKLMFFFEMEGSPDLGNRIINNSSQFMEFYNDIKLKLPDLINRTEEARDESELKHIEKELLEVLSLKELVDNHKAAINELMKFAKKAKLKW